MTEQHSVREVDKMKQRTKLIWTCVCAMINMWSFSGVARAALVAYWDFDYGGAEDRYGRYHGTIGSSAIWTTDRQGDGGEFSFNGKRGGVKIPDNPRLRIQEKITLAAWIRVDAFDQNWRPIVFKGRNAWMLRRAPNMNTVRFQCKGVTRNDTQGPDRQGINGATNVNDGKWHHIAGVYDGTRLLLYVDGRVDAVADASGTISISSEPVSIGGQFKGSIDEVVIFDHALSPDEVRQLYQDGKVPAVPTAYTTRFVTEAEAQASKLSPERMIDFLEKKISLYHQWRVRNLDTLVCCDRKISPDVYFLLGQSMESAGRPQKDVAKIYQRALACVTVRSRHVPEMLLWLHRNVPASEYREIVRTFARGNSVLAYDLYHAARYFAASDNWPAFCDLMNCILSDSSAVADRAPLYASVVAKALENTPNWVYKFQDYCNQKSELMAYTFHEQISKAEGQLARQDYEGAAKTYQQIASQCGPNQNKAVYEFAVCDCLFRSDRYDVAIKEIDSFIQRNRMTNPGFVCKAVTLKGQAYVHLGDFDRAIDEFLTLLIEQPESNEASEAGFFIGYCYMLQGKFDEAKDAFDLVVKEYPESSFTSKADLYLTRIKNMTE